MTTVVEVLKETKTPTSTTSKALRLSFEMATAEGASAAIANLDGKLLQLREKKKRAEEREEGKEKEEEKQGVLSLDLSPSLVLLVSDKVFASSYSSSSGAERAQLRQQQHPVRVAHARSKEAWEQQLAARE
mgnify:CR=1 FL=1